MAAQAAMKLLPAILPPAKRAGMKVAVEGSASVGMDVHFVSGDTSSQMASICTPLFAAVFLGIGMYFLRTRDWRHFSEKAQVLLRTLRYRLKLASYLGVKIERPSKTPPRDPAAYKYIGKGNSRMTVELCAKCISTNRFLREVAEKTGKTIDTFEACEDCRQAMVQMQDFKDSPKLGMRC